MKLFRKLSLIMAMALFVSSFGSMGVHADEITKKPAPKPIELSNLEITNVDVPTPGKPLDKAATVVSAEGVSWDIPVVWVDEAGKTAIVAEAGKRYFPTFVMYVPSQYIIKGTDASGRFPVKLPAFLAQLGIDKLIFAVDPATRLIYIFNAPGYDTFAAGYSSGAESGKTSGEEANDSSDDDDDDGELTLFEKYCAQSAIDRFESNYPGFLEWLIDVIMNEIQPQAVTLLEDGFPVFKEAAQKGQLSSKLGLYIYDRTGNVDGMDTPEEALAYVNGVYDNDMNFRMLMGVDTESFRLSYDETTDMWLLDERDRDTLDNTIIHEMLHGFMYDYTRSGLDGFCYEFPNLRYGYPIWFVEGIATAVENGVQYRANHFIGLSDRVYPDYNYTAESVRAAFNYLGDNRLLYGLNYADKQVKDVGPDFDYSTSAYSTGYLAAVYLGYLDAKTRGKDAALSGGKGYDIDIIRDGVNNILSQLHGTGDGSDNKTLNAIIAEVSNNNFTGIKDFQNRFGVSDPDSQQFMAGYLQMLKTIAATGDTMMANGSILLSNDEQVITSPIERGHKPGAPDVYAIQDAQGSAVSDVDDVRANTTGGGYVNGDGSHNYLAEGKDANEVAAIAASIPVTDLAAKASVVDTMDEEAPMAETPEAEDPVAEVPAAEPPAVEEPIAEPPAVDEPASDAPVAEAPAVEEPAAETPVEDTPAEDTAAEDTSSDETEETETETEESSES